jgi:hypothetical protein
MAAILVRNTPNDRFTLMWTSIFLYYILRENERPGEDA